MAIQNVYCDSNAPVAGDGSLATPYKALASINWTTITTWITAGDTVNLNLKCGSFWRENLSIGASGVLGRPITVQSYSTGSVPAINGSDALSSWAASGAGLGSTWQATGGATTANNVYYLGIRMIKGASATTLNNMEWFQSGTTYYFRLDPGTPANGAVEAEQRACVTQANRTYITLTELDLCQGSTGINGSSATSNSTYNYLRFIDCHTPFVASTTALSCELGYCQFIRGGGGGAQFSMTLGGSGQTYTLKYCLFRDSLARNVYSQYGVSLEIDNCVFAGAVGYPSEAVKNTASTMTVTVKNCIGSGFTATAGTLSISNSILMYAVDGSSGLSGVTLGTGNIWALPQFTVPGVTGFINWSVDDGDYIYAVNGTKTLQLANAGFGGFTLADIGTASLAGNATKLAAVQNLVALGGEEACHTRDFVGDMTNLAAIKIYCTNYGTSTTVTLSIGGNVLTTSVDGVTDITLDLTNTAYNTLSKVTTYINGRTGALGVVYSCANNACPQTPNVASYTLADASAVNIRVAAAVAFNFDQTKYWTEEILYNKTDIESALGNGYVAPTFIYPGGYYNAALTTWLGANGFAGGRTAGTYNVAGLYLRNLSQWAIVGAASNIQGTLFVSKEGNGTDTGGNSYTFTTSGYGTHFGDYYELPTEFGFSSNLTSGTAYMYRASMAKLDYRNADWSVGMLVKPTRLTGAETYTLFYHGDATGTANYTRLWLSADGAAHFVIVVAGAVVIQLDSAAGVFTTTAARKIFVRQFMGKIQVFTGAGAVTNPSDANLISNTLLVEVATTTVPGAGSASYAGNVYFGASSDGAGGVTNNFVGYLGTTYMGQDTARKALGVAWHLGTTGQTMSLMHHSDIPYDIVKTFADAINFAVGKGYDVRVKTFKDMVAFVIAQTGVTSDGLYLRWNQADISSFTLKSTSPAIDAGASLSYTTDLAGKVVPRGSAPDIGAYEYYPTDRVGFKHLSFDIGFRW